MGGRNSLWTAAGALVLLVSNSALAAELTDVLDAFDYANDNPYDFRFEPEFFQDFERGLITREALCPPGADASNCPVFNRELDYRRATTGMDLNFRFALYRDLEFSFGIPIVFSDRRKLEFAAGVSELNSSVDPSDERIANDTDPGSGGADPTEFASQFFNTYRFFDVPSDGTSRSGVGDASIWLKWSPYSQEVQEQGSTLTVGFGYLAPTGKPARATNTGVGRGVHELSFSIASSRLFRDVVDPYWGFDFTLPISASSGLFDSDPNAERSAPGIRFVTTTGAEVVMYADESSQQKYTFDLGAHFGYQFEGRDYNPLFDALANSTCNGTTPTEVGYGAAGPDGNAYVISDRTDLPSNAECAWIVQQPGLAEQSSGTAAGSWEYSHDGITDVDAFATIGGHFDIGLRFNQWVGARIGSFIEFETPHFLTAADAGRDRDGDDTVLLDPTPTDGEVERNPNFNQALDTVGRRFRLENAVNLGWHFTLSFGI